MAEEKPQSTYDMLSEKFSVVLCDAQPEEPASSREPPAADGDEAEKKPRHHSSLGERTHRALDRTLEAAKAVGASTRKLAVGGMEKVLRRGKSKPLETVEIPDFRAPRDRDVACLATKRPKGPARHYYHQENFADAAKAREVFGELPPLASLCARGTAAYALYTRAPGAPFWVREAEAGAAVDVETLCRWADLPEAGALEAPARRAAAHVGGFVARAVLWLAYQRHRPQLRPHQGMRATFLIAVNALVGAWWPFLRALINVKVRVSVKAAVNDLLKGMAKAPVKSITSLDVDVGAEPPTLTAVALAPSFTGYDYLDLDVGFTLNGDAVSLDAEIDVGGDARPDLRVHVTRLAVAGNLRLKLGPLIAPLPCASALRVGFTAKPTIKLATEFEVYDTVGLPCDVGLSRLNRFLSRLIENVLDTYLCWPRSVAVPLAETLLGADFAAAAEPEPAPIGALHLAVTHATDLINNDAVTGGDSDPYVILTVGQQERQTPTIEDENDPVWEDPETFAFDVYESSQHVDVRVYDSEADEHFFHDCLLGVASVAVDDLGGRIADAQAAEGGGARRFSATTLATPTEIALELDTSVYAGKSKIQVLMGRRFAPPSKVYLRAHFVAADTGDARLEHRPKASEVLAKSGAAVAAAAAVLVAAAAYGNRSLVAAFTAAGAVGAWLATTALVGALALLALGKSV